MGVSDFDNGKTINIYEYAKGHPARLRGSEAKRYLRRQDASIVAGAVAKRAKKGGLYD